MNLKKIGCGILDLILVAYDSDPWQALVNAVRNRYIGRLSNYSHLKKEVIGCLINACILLHSSQSYDG
jgi:hypothetical protein